MKPNKNQLRGLVVLAVLLAVYHVIVFVIPFPHRGPFWPAYLFGLAAILAQAGILWVAFRGADSPRSKFYGIPIARVGVLYLAIQLCLSLVAMALGFIEGCPGWPFAVLFALLLAAVVLGVAATDATRDELQRQDGSLRRSVSKMRALQSLGQTLAAQCEDPAAEQELRKLADELRFSDPVSSPATAGTETELAGLLDELQRALLEGDIPGVTGLCRRARTVLAERNRICKLNKM